jgi:fructokinase
MTVATIRIGIDLGGTKIEIVALDADNRIRLRERIFAPRGDYAATIQAVRDLVLSAETKLGETARIGIAVPGTISPATGLMKNANSQWLNGKPLDRDLQRVLDRDIRIANDANCFALSEAVDGAGKEVRTVFGVILGTGVGGGIVIDRNIVTGAHAIAGEWGHNQIPYMRKEERSSTACYCGKYGCNETFLSGAGLAADYIQSTGEKISPEDIVKLAVNSDVAARATLDRYVDRLARALSCVINILDPDVIVLGGGLSNIDALYGEVPRHLSEHVFSDICTTPILRNAHGDSSGVRGAAWLWEIEESAQRFV